MKNNGSDNFKPLIEMAEIGEKKGPDRSFKVR